MKIFFKEKILFTLLNLNFILIITKHHVTNAAFADWSEDQAPEKWNKLAKNTIDDLLKREINTGLAKNIIMFGKLFVLINIKSRLKFSISIVGDGMGISTVAAGRIRKGQMKGQNGEEVVTNMESLPHLALSKVNFLDKKLN